MLHPIDRAEQYLTDIGLIDRSGAVLYSSVETLKPGPVYLLGLNPGGAEGATLRDSIAASRRGNNAFLDEEWAPGGRPRERGKALLQRRVQALCHLMGCDPRDVPVSNLAFTRSARIAALPDFDAVIRACEPVHQIFAGVIKPNFIMTFGNIKHFAKYAKFRKIESRSAQHAAWKAFRGQALIFGREVRFGNVPHVSIWASDTREEVIRWALEGLGVDAD